MKFIPLELSDVMVVEPHRVEDERGFFWETHRDDAFAQVGITCAFVQENTSWSVRKGTVRGLHFQHGPAAQAKLIRVLRGAIYDVFLDLRPNSPTYRQWGAIELKCEELRLLYIPKGFAHGFCTLRDDTEVSYRLSNYYAPEAEGGVLWSDPELAIPWPVSPEAAIVNARDSAWPLLQSFSEGNAPSHRVVAQ